MTLPCALAGRCGGCPEHTTPLAEQRRRKVAALEAALAREGVAAAVIARAGASIETPAALGFRQHLDLRWQPSANGSARLGLIARDPAAGVVDMAACPLATPELGAWLTEVRAHPLPIGRASLRLRAATGARRGVWVDCAHADVKALLDAGWAAALAGDDPEVIVELGPKARRVEGSRLVEPTLCAWSTTFDGERALPLYTTVRAFSQPGAVPNRALVAAVVHAVLEVAPSQVLELGAGAGNLTLPLLARGLAVRAVELDTTSLARSASEAGLSARLEAFAQSFERAADLAPLVAGVDLVLADPPRQGLGRFIDALAGLSSSLRPAAMVYVSCHPEALAKDVARLAPLGYRLESLRGIDQFPWTAHAEWVARLTR